MNLIQQLTQAQWKPVPPPKRGEDKIAFRISMLLPGFTTAYHMHTLGRCQTSIADYRAEAAEHEPELRSEVSALAGALTPADGMVMARLRGQCQMPFWSRLAIVEYRKLGWTYPEIAAAFGCAERTVGNAVSRSNFLVPERRLTRYQMNPPARITRRRSSIS